MERDPLLSRQGYDNRTNDDEDPDTENPPTTTTTTTTTTTESLYQLTQRVRCWLQIITWPIGPSFTILVFAWLYLVYASLILNNQGTAFRTYPFFLPIATTTTPSEPDEEPCSHPLHTYARISILLGLYAPYHSRVREYICTRFVLQQQQRQQHSTTTTTAVIGVTKRFDQIIHTMALLYVYAGISLVSTCRQDHVAIDDTSSSSTDSNDAAVDAADGSWMESIRSKQQQQQQQQLLLLLNTCQATCPVLTQAVFIYVGMLEIFTLSIILPLLVLPCIYLWFLRQATTQQIMQELQQRLESDEDDDEYDEEEEDEVDEDDGERDDDHHDPERDNDGFANIFINSNRRNHPRRHGVTAKDILRRLQTVQLIRLVAKELSTNYNDEEAEILVVPIEDEDNHNNDNNLMDKIEQAKRNSSSFLTPINRECCICMSEFQISDHYQKENTSCTDDEDLEIGRTESNDLQSTVETIVRTPECRHLFHKQCIATWVGGQWENINNRSSGTRTMPHHPIRSNVSGDVSSENAPSEEVSTNANISTIPEALETNSNRYWRTIPNNHHRRRAKRTTCPLCRADLSGRSSRTSSRNSNNTQNFGTLYGSIE